jgi:hypothetical protein
MVMDQPLGYMVEELEHPDQVELVHKDQVGLME